MVAFDSFGVFCSQERHHRSVLQTTPTWTPLQADFGDVTPSI